MYYKENRNCEEDGGKSIWIINCVCVILTLLTYDSEEEIQSLAIKLISLSVSFKMNKILSFPVYSLKFINKIKSGFEFNLKSIEAIDVKVNITSLPRYSCITQ